LNSARPPEEAGDDESADAMRSPDLEEEPLRSVTVELRTLPPRPPAVDRATPENRRLAEEIDALDRLKEAELIRQ
jgi:hypothetical protein